MPSMVKVLPALGGVVLPPRSDAVLLSSSTDPLSVETSKVGFGGAFNRAVCAALVLRMPKLWR